MHYPIDYSQAINSPEACKRRLFKYVVPVIVLAVVINIPRFLESEVKYDKEVRKNRSRGKFACEFPKEMANFRLLHLHFRAHPHYHIKWNYVKSETRPEKE